MTFNITLTRDASNGQPLGRRLLQGYVPLGGQSINVGFGDGTSNVTVTTASDGTASVLHTFAASGTYNTIATYAGTIKTQHIIHSLLGACMKGGRKCFKVLQTYIAIEALYMVVEIAYVGHVYICAQDTYAA